MNITTEAIIDSIEISAPIANTTNRTVSHAEIVLSVPILKINKHKYSGYILKYSTGKVEYTGMIGELKLNKILDMNAGDKFVASISSMDPVKIEYLKKVK